MNIGNVSFHDRAVFLAPLEDITDLPYRLICKDYGADLVYTEFVSSEALIRGIDRSLQKTQILEKERPVAIQIFGHDINSMAKAAEQVAAYCPDIIDINWGCPVRKVVSKGAGSAILKDIPKMVAITKAVVDAVNIPVTVKTRLGWDHNSKPIIDVAERLQDVGIKAISIHGRTRSQLYGGTADWSLIGAVKNNPRMYIPIIGNGDIDSAETAAEKFNTYGVDALMVGRAAIGNPWIFTQIKAYLNQGEILPFPSIHERLSVCRKHLAEEIKYKNAQSAVIEMRKQYTKYFKGIDDFKKFRMQLMQTTTAEETEDIFKKIEAYYSSF